MKTILWVFLFSFSFSFSSVWSQTKITSMQLKLSPNDAAINPHAKACSVENKDDVCIDYTLRPITTHFYFKEESCKRMETADCTEFLNYWFPINKIVFYETMPSLHFWSSVSPPSSDRETERVASEPSIYCVGGVHPELSQDCAACGQGFVLGGCIPASQCVGTESCLTSSPNKIALGTPQPQPPCPPLGPCSYTPATSVNWNDPKTELVKALDDNAAQARLIAAQKQVIDSQADVITALKDLIKCRH